MRVTQASNVMAALSFILYLLILFYHEYHLYICMYVDSFAGQLSVLSLGVSCFANNKMNPLNDHDWNEEYRVEAEHSQLFSMFISLIIFEIRVISNIYRDLNRKKWYSCPNESRRSLMAFESHRLRRSKRYFGHKPFSAIITKKVKKPTKVCIIPIWP